MTTDQLSALLRADADAVIENDTAVYRAQIDRAAAIMNAHMGERPLVLLAGPSGSGKTTTARLLERALNDLGRPCRTISMDDYFLPLSQEEKLRLKRNELDLETPARMDIPLFRRNLDDLLACRPFALPRYDFPTSSRVYDRGEFCRKADEIVILEGIHALNPEVTGHEGSTERLYVSVRTRITARDGSLMHPSLIRLARRMLRDRLCRNRELTQTLAMWQRVDAGEKRYIMPFKPRAHFSIDSFFSCELSLYREAFLPDLRVLAAQEPALRELVQVMQELPSLPTSAIPRESLIREFIGGSSLT